MSLDRLYDVEIALGKNIEDLYAKLSPVLKYPVPCDPAVDGVSEESDFGGMVAKLEFRNGQIIELLDRVVL